MARSLLPSAITPTEIEKTNQLSAARYSLYREVLRRVVYFHQSTSEIAKDLDLNYQQVYKVITDPFFKELQREAEDGVDALMKRSTSGILAAASPHAARKLVQYSDYEDPVISLKSCTEILDRTGHGKAEKVTLEQTIHIDDGDKKALAKALGSLNEGGNGNGKRKTETTETAENTPSPDVG